MKCPYMVLFFSFIFFILIHLKSCESPSQTLFHMLIRKPCTKKVNARMPHSVLTQGHLGIEDRQSNNRPTNHWMESAAEPQQLVPNIYIHIKTVHWNMFLKASVQNKKENKKNIFHLLSNLQTDWEKNWVSPYDTFMVPVQILSVVIANGSSGLNLSVGYHDTSVYI